MSKFFSFCKANNKKHGLKDQPIEFKPRKTYNYCFYISVFLLCLIFVAVGFYIFNTTSSVTKGFAVSKYEQKINDLKLTNENLKERVNNLEDLNYVKEKAVEMGLVAVGDVEYLENGQGGVVLK